MTTPTPQTWTLRLKSHKTTVLLHIDPLHTFDTIKAALYDALQQTEFRHPDTGAAIPLPPSPSDIQLGRPVNINDAHEGFKLGEWEYNSIDDAEEVEGKGKGKAKAVAPGGKGAASAKQCPKGAGLKDGAVLAPGCSFRRRHSFYSFADLLNTFLQVYLHRRWEESAAVQSR